MKLTRHEVSRGVDIGLGVALFAVFVWAAFYAPMGLVVLGGILFLIGVCCSVGLLAVWLAKLVRGHGDG